MTAGPLDGAVQRFLVDPGIPGVFIPAPLCAELNDLADLDRLRKEQRGGRPDLYALLLAIHFAALKSGSGSGTGFGTGPGTFLDGNQPPIASSDQCDVNEASARLGMTTRAVRKAAAAGRLAGQHVAGRWLFTTTSIETFRASRRRTH